jgi:agmatine deiminase
MDIENQIRWPAEWEPQAATWIAWPHNRSTWPGYFDPVPSIFARFICELSSVQRVHVLSGPKGITPAANELLDEVLDQYGGRAVNISVHKVPTNDVWIRDYGPTFVHDPSQGRLVAINWRFNAWGGKYLPCDFDSAAGAAICKILACRRVASPIICEGGGLETDGRGTLLTTSSVLLSSTRNPGLSRGDIEQELAQRLGVSKFVWVDGGGLEGDDTDGHIDQLARFVSPGVVVAAVSSSSADSNHAGLAANLQLLQQATDASGQRLNVVPLPTPLPRFVDGRRVPESYCNFLIANHIVIVPTFRAPTDEAALRLFEELMPDHRIVPLDAYDLIWGLGAFHCASQQQPAAPK